MAFAVSIKNTTPFNKWPPAGLIVCDDMQSHYTGFRLKTVMFLSMYDYNNFKVIRFFLTKRELINEKMSILFGAIMRPHDLHIVIEELWKIGMRVNWKLITLANTYMSSTSKHCNILVWFHQHDYYIYMPISNLRNNEYIRNKSNPNIKRPKATHAYLNFIPYSFQTGDVAWRPLLGKLSWYPAILVSIIHLKIGNL